MTKLQRTLLKCLTAGALLLLTGCNMVLLQPKGLIAADEKNLLITAVLLMLIVVIPVIVLSFYVARRYRASNTRATYAPKWTHNVWIEVVCWGVPLIIIGILATITWTSTHRLDPYRPLNDDKKPLVIQVVALNWKWLFIYPEQKIATVNFVEMPVNKEVRFLITADAPMNSFQIPALGSQIYAMPGMQTKLHLIADTPGDYNGMSANFSGQGFSGMKFIARVASNDDFNTWVKQEQASPNSLTLSTYDLLAKPSENNPVASYTLVEADLFNDILMKYMMPMPAAAPGAATQSDKMPGMQMSPNMESMPRMQTTRHLDYKNSRDYKHHKDLISPKTNQLIKG